MSDSPLDRFAEDLRDPADGSPLEGFDAERVRFRGGREYPRIDGAPVLIDEARSLFPIADVVARRATPQSAAYRDPRRLRNRVRMRLLPSLGHDREQDAEHRRLAAEAAGRPVLVLGAGDKLAIHRQVFAASPLVLSDVHLGFGVDFVVDAHRIPFRDDLFALVLAAQVLEHTARPWEVAAEVERVTAPGGRVQIEVPFAFPGHGQPYDFYRFTPSGLRFLFPRCELERMRAAEGAAAATATFAAQALVDKLSGRTPRRIALVVARFLFGWLPALDRLPTFATAQRMTAPRGLAFTGRKDGRRRSDKELLDDARRFC